jgi:hypothetical protein
MDNLFIVKGGRRGIKVAIYSNRCLCCGERGGAPTLSTEKDCILTE